MADISTKITAFKNAVYGSNVKSTMTDLLNTVETTNTFNFGTHSSGNTIRLYRGKCLGVGPTFEQASTKEQRTAIRNGTYVDMFIGDYWEVNDVIYRIADINYWYQSGGGTTAHYVLVPDISFGIDNMNEEDSTIGAYALSTIKNNTKSLLNKVKDRITVDFGRYLFTIRRTFPNTTVDGAQSACSWYNSTVDFMTEFMVFGTYNKCKKNDGSYISTSDRKQLRLFQLNPTLINLRTSYWLLDVASEESFVIVSANGTSSSANASTMHGVRPVFAIKG